MKKTAIAIATAGLLLLIAGPALADRDDRDHRHKYRGVPKSHQAGRSLRGAHHKEQRRSERDQRGKHQPQHRPDRNRSHGGDRSRERERRQQQERVRHERERVRHERERISRERKQHQRRERERNQRRDRDNYWDRDRYPTRVNHDRRDRNRDHGGRHGHRYSWARHHKPRRPIYRHGHSHYRPRWRPAHYHYGYRWARLPSSFVSISIGGLGFYYSDGIFYRPYGPAYVVAQPPIGAVVYTLPASAVTVVFGGYNYYVAYDTYYLWDGRGYRVVANPGIIY